MLEKNFDHTGGHLDCDEKFRLKIGKGVYPYEYINGWYKFEETKFPLKTEFHSKLNMKVLSDSDYEHDH